MLTLVTLSRDVDEEEFGCVDGKECTFRLTLKRYPTRGVVQGSAWFTSWRADR